MYYGHNARARVSVGQSQQKCYFHCASDRRVEQSNDRTRWPGIVGSSVASCDHSTSPWIIDFVLELLRCVVLYMSRKGSLLFIVLK